MHTFLMVVQLLVGVALIALVLLQHGKGADAGAAFGSGASGTVFGARGAANFLSRSTAWMAFVFFAVSLSLAYLVHTGRDDGSLVDRVGDATALEAPADGQGAETPQIPEAAAEEPPAGPVIPE